MTLEFTQELNDVVTRFKTLSQRVSAFVRGLNDEVKKLESVPDASARIKKDQARSLIKTFQTLLNEFSEEQLNYKQQCEKAISKYLKICE